MSMKTANAPRRVYVRNGVTHVLYAGTVFGTKGETQVKTSVPVKIVGNGDQTVTVSQKTRSHRGPTKTVSEVWSAARVPCSAR
jgi:hypothetical protein